MSRPPFLLPPHSTSVPDVNLIDLQTDVRLRRSPLDEFDPMASSPTSPYAELSRALADLSHQSAPLPIPPPPEVSPVLRRHRAGTTPPSHPPSRPPSGLYPSLAVPESPVTLRHRTGRLGIHLSSSTSALHEAGARESDVSGHSGSSVELRVHSGRERLRLTRHLPSAECQTVVAAVEEVRGDVDGGAVEEHNPGLVFNPVARRPFPLPDSVIVGIRFGRLLARLSENGFHKISVNPNTTEVSMLLTSAIPWDDFPVGSTPCLSDFFLRVHGREEFLRPSARLAEHAYFQDCNRQQWPIRLVLDHREDLHPERLKRTARDISEPFIMPAKPDCKELSRDELQLLLEVFKKEKDSFYSNFRYSPESNSTYAGDCVRLVQSVKAIVASMDHLTTLDVLSSLERLESHMMRGQVFRDDIQCTLDRLEAGVQALVRLYCGLYELPYTLEETARDDRTVKVYKSTHDCQQTVTVYVGGLHRILASKLYGYDLVRVRAVLTYASHPLTGVRHTVTKGQPVRSTARLRSPVSGAPAPSVPLFWDEWLLFEGVPVSQLPLETVLLLSLVGVRKSLPQGSSPPSGVHADVPQSLGWATLPLFDAACEYRQGVQLVPLWPASMPMPLAGAAPLNFDPNSPVLEIAMPELKEPLHFPEKNIGDYEDIQIAGMDSLSLEEQDELRRVLHSDEASTGSLNYADRRRLWTNRHCLLDRSDALLKVLMASPVGCPPPADMYSLVRLWRIPEPELALQLLGPELCDREIRSKSVQWLRCQNPDELMLYMPQLVQVLKYDLYTNWSGLFALLLEYSLKNMNFANSLFWHLKECPRTSLHARRIQTLFAALLRSCGAAMKAVWRGQETMTSLLSTAAEAVRAASTSEGKEARLQVELTKLKDWMEGEGADLCPLRIPFNIGLIGPELNIRDCSYFSSFTCPLRLVFRSPDEEASDLNIMFKAGDDLRQDSLMLQLTTVMDRLWLQDGLDLRMVLFRILSTSGKQGFIELVSESTTLRKIQESKGVTGAFRECVIRTWLQRHNSTQLEYRMAVSNFMASCAGCCVATYVLGVGDRHNDNIMIGKAGHMVHIDFAKILGDAQTFAGIKRDRVPFVFTPEMARVLQDAGELESDGRSGFQAFIDLCCRALNILRGRADLLLGLARLLLPAKIPGLKPDGVAHMRRALMLELSDLEVTAQFARLIEKSLGSMSTTLNFFIHGLAQAKHSGHDEGALLSFMPKNYTIKTDGKINGVTIRSVQKAYSPDREYRFILAVYRAGYAEPWSLIRYFSQFEELHRRLTQRYPLAPIPPLAEPVALPGRSHVRGVAEKRWESLQVFVNALLEMAPEISECDTVYTFFHTTLQDEQDVDKLEMDKLKDSPTRNRESNRQSGAEQTGEIELRVRYQGDQLNVLVMQAKQLRGGSGEPPDTYVKAYLRPDENKQTKQKSRVVRRNFNPSYNQLMEYKNITQSSLDHWTLEVSVWECGVVRSVHLGSVRLPLNLLLTQKDSQRWYVLV